MRNLLLILLALLPAPVFFFFIMRGLVITKAKWFLIAAISLAAAASIALVYYVQLTGVGLIPRDKLHAQPYATLINLFFIGPSEELAKFIPVLLLVWRSREFKNVYDGILFSSVMAIAFATIENVYGCLQFGLTTAIGRIFFSVPLHVAFGVFTGYFLGQAKMAGTSKEACYYLIKGIVLVSFLHGSVDALFEWSVNVRLTCLFLVVPLLIFFMIKTIRAERKKLFQ